MNIDAIFSDNTEDYRSPVEPNRGDEVEIRLRVARDDAREVWLVTEDDQIPMEKAYSKNIFDYYTVKITIKNTIFRYGFRIQDDHQSVYYDRQGISGGREMASMFSINPDVKTPAWAKGAVMYQIFVDRFYDGNPDNNVRTGEYTYLKRQVEGVKDWDSLPEPFDVHRFYGGDLQGVLDKLDYLQNLGVEVLYLNPIFVSPSNHKYDSQDYDAVDPHYAVIRKDGDYVTRVTTSENLKASNEFFAHFMEEVHRRGMRVIIDGVMNHCGSFHKWMNREKLYTEERGYPKGAYESKDSPYHDYFHFTKNSWPDNPSYEEWWGNETLPKLNYEGSSLLWERIIELGRRWVSPPYCVDGWRLDVAADLGHSPEVNHRFWKEFRENVHQANPEAIVLAEHYSDPYPWIQNGEWDTVMNYAAFMDPVTWYLTGMEKHSDFFRGDLLGNASAFWTAMNHNFPRLGNGKLIAMNELSNHDHSRFLTRTNRIPGRLGNRSSEEASQGIRMSNMYQAVVMQMTWPGAPTIYYGDEAGVCGWTDPDDRRTYPWGKENTGLIDFHRTLIGIHKSHPALRLGSLHKLYGEGSVIAYARTLGDEVLVTIVNAGTHRKVVRIPVWITGAGMNSVFVNQVKTSPVGYDQIPDRFTVSDGILTIEMEGESSIILEEIPEEIT